MSRSGESEKLKKFLAEIATQSGAAPKHFPGGGRRGRYDFSKPRAAEPEPLPEPQVEFEAPKVGYLPGVCGEIQHFIFEQSSYPSLILSRGASFSVVGSLIFGEVAGPTGAYGTSTHLYTVFIGVTGFGKQFIIRGIKTCLRASTAMANLIGPDGFVSGSAIVKEMADRRRLVVNADEFGQWLSRLGRGGQHFEQDQARVIKTLWGTGYGEVWDTPASKTDPTVAVPSPSLTLNGFTTRDRFYDACEDEQIMDGLLNRFMSYEDPGRSDYVEVGEEKGILPAALKAQLILLGGECLDPLRVPFSGIVKPKRKLIWGKGAEEVFVALREARDAEEDPAKRELCERMPEMAIRYATVLAAGCFNPVLERSYMEIVKEDVLASVARMSKGIIEDGAPKPIFHHGEMARKIMKYVREEFAKQVALHARGGPEPEGVSKSAITNRFNPHAKYGHDVAQALNSLLGVFAPDGAREGGLLEEGEVRTGGRPRQVFWPASAKKDA